MLLLVPSLELKTMDGISSWNDAIHPTRLQIKYMQVYVAACLGLEGGVGNIVNRYLEKKL